MKNSDPLILFKMYGLETNLLPHFRFSQKNLELVFYDFVEVEGFEPPNDFHRC